MIGLFIISVAAELTGVHPQTLRTYERKGLIHPTRSAGGTRRYSQADVDRVRLIQTLTQDEGINLAGVRRILEQQDRITQLESRLDQAHQAIEDARREAARANREASRHTSTELVVWSPPAIEPARRLRRY